MTAPQTAERKPRGASDYLLEIRGLKTHFYTQDGTVSSNWKTSLFIDGNKEKLARDMSVGSGETLDSLAHLLGVESQDRAAFNRAAKENMARIFPSHEASSQEIATALREVLASDTRLSRYTAAL